MGRCGSRMAEGAALGDFHWRQGRGDVTVVGVYIELFKTTFSHMRLTKLWASYDGLKENHTLFVEDTFKKEDQDKWLDMLGTEEQDILLSPLQPDLNPELLVAILKTLKSATTHEIHRFARGTWNHQARADDWKACAEQSLRRVNMKRTRDGTCHVSLRGAVCQKLDALNMLSHEAFVFSFLKRVDGQIFQCLGSIAESMFYYSQQCPVDKPMCYKLIEHAIRAGHIANLSNPCAGETRSGLHSKKFLQT